MISKLIETMWEWIEDPLEEFCENQGIDFYSVYEIKKTSGAISALAFFLASVLHMPLNPRD